MADTKIIVNCETGEVQELELTAEEVAQREADAKAFVASKAAEEKAEADKAAAREAIAAKVGLTPADLALLLGL